jgi:hypothetical protein
LTGSSDGNARESEASDEPDDPDDVAGAFLDEVEI